MPQVCTLFATYVALYMTFQKAVSEVIQISDPSENSHTSIPLTKSKLEVVDLLVV